MAKKKGKSLYLKASEQDLIKAALNFHSFHLQEEYEKPDSKEWYLESMLDIRDLLMDKFEK